MNLKEFKENCERYATCRECPIAHLTDRCEELPMNWDVDAIEKAVKHER